MNRTAGYQVRLRVQGELDSRWSSVLAGLAVALAHDGTTVLAGELADQAAVHGLLGLVRDLGLCLLSVEAFALPSPASSLESRGNAGDRRSCRTP